MNAPFMPLNGIAFQVHGTPAPQGSKRGFVAGGRAIVVDDNPAPLRTWREDVKHAALDAMNGHTPFEGPLLVLITFRLPRPKTTKRVLPSVRPDLDKLTRSTLDALKTGGVFGDDAQVCELHARKEYGQPGADVTVRGVDLAAVAEVAA